MRLSFQLCTDVIIFYKEFRNFLLGGEFWRDISLRQQRCYNAMNVQTPNGFARLSTFHFLYNNFIVLNATSVRKEILQLLMQLLPLLSCVCITRFILWFNIHSDRSSGLLWGYVRSKVYKTSSASIYDWKHQVWCAFKGSIRKRHNALWHPLHQECTELHRGHRKIVIFR